MLKVLQTMFATCRKAIYSTLEKQIKLQNTFYKPHRSAKLQFFPAFQKQVCAMYKFVCQMHLHTVLN